MTRQGKWLLIGGIVVGLGAAWALGVPLGVLVIVALFLACPLTMYFGMRGMGMRHDAGGDRMHEHSEGSAAEPKAEGRERHTTHNT